MIDQVTTVARLAGELLLERFHQPRTVDHKGRSDLVTDADLASERLVVSWIEERFPDHHVLAEEGSATEEASEDGYTWVVDPLDGTTNYAHGLPIWAVSVGLLKGRRPVAGAVCVPMLGELYAAEEGGGATLNGAPIRVSDAGSLKDAVLATGFPYDKHESVRDNCDNVCAFIKRARGIRRMGAAAVDLAFVAGGRLDGFWEEKLSPWDLAAGALIAREAGAVVSAYDGGPLDLWGGNSVAAGPGIHREMVEVLTPYARRHGLGGSAPIDPRRAQD